MNDEYLDYSWTTILGKSGITRPCVTAMAAILSSVFRPQKITAVIGDFDELGRHEAVLFLVWDWADQDLTIIPDGFGTHGGGGGAGLSAVLALIKFYEIPLQQVWIQKKEAFKELAKGTLTEEMFNEVQKARDYDWDFYRVSEFQKVKRGKQHVLEIKHENGNNYLSIPLS